MKLNTQQTDKIRAFLDSQNLNFQEFYDEMLDHLILETEARMEKHELSFETAIKMVLDQFRVPPNSLKVLLWMKNEEYSFRELEKNAFKREAFEVRLLFGRRILKNLFHPYFLLSAIIAMFLSGSFSQEFTGLGMNGLWFLVAISSFHGGLSFQLFENKPVKGLIVLRGGLLDSVLSPDRISLMRRNAAWKTLLFSFGFAGLTVLSLLSLPKFSLSLLIISLIVNILIFFSSIQFVSEKRQLDISWN